MKRTIISALILGLVSVSCTKEVPNDKSIVENGGLTLTAVSNSIGTKAEMAYSYDVLWQSADKIYVKDASGENDSFTLSNGAGTSIGTFKQDHSISFTGQVEAFYPQNVGESMKWPAYQSNSGNIAPMYAKKEILNPSAEVMSFTSLGAVLHIVFNSTSPNTKIRSIHINADEPMSGAFTVDSNGKAVLTGGNGGITLTLGDGVDMGSSSKYFNIAIPAGTYHNVVLTFTQTAYSKCVLHSSSLTIPHNSVAKVTLSGSFPMPTDIINGRFSVSENKVVAFSKGNLQATYQDLKYSWGFAEKQNGSIGNASGNTTIDAQINGAKVDLFGWSTPATYYGIYTPEDPDDPVYLGDFIDWGTTLEDTGKWFTLSSDEWWYLVKSRPNASDLLKTNVSVGGVPCTIIAPDNWNLTLNPLKLEYTDAEFALAENLGLVCLPTVCGRDGNEVTDRYIFYHTSTPFLEDWSLKIIFDRLDMVYGSSRKKGGYVRLVTEL